MNVSFVIHKAVKYFTDVYCGVKKIDYVQPDMYYLCKKIQISFPFPCVPCLQLFA